MSFVIFTHRSIPLGTLGNCGSKKYHIALPNAASEESYTKIKNLKNHVTTLCSHPCIGPFLVRDIS